MTIRPIRYSSWTATRVAAICIAFTPTLAADRGEPPGVLLGGGFATEKPAADLDPRLPTGPLLRSASRPRGLAHIYCGASTPVCIHYDDRVDAALASKYLNALEHAHAQLVGALRLPSPLRDPGLGPTSGLDLYLSSAAPEPGLDLVVVADPRSETSDRSSGFCRARASRSEHETLAGTCVGELILLGLDAAETPHLRRAMASYLWSSLGHTSAGQLEAFDRVQSNPQLGVAGSPLEPESAGAALLFQYVNRRLGVGSRGSLPAALLQLSRAQTPAGAARWNNEPDAIDVLRQAFHKADETFDDFLLNFAVDRAFWGARDNGEHDRELFWLGDAGRVRFEWKIEASSLPRRVAPLRPLEPLGTAYLWLELDRVSVTGTLAVRAEWEAPGVFRWTLVAVDARGHLLRRYDLPYVQNATSAERTIVDYAEAAALLVVGTHLGGVDLAHPFDPDFDPPEPHGFTVYIAEI